MDVSFIKGERSGVEKEEAKLVNSLDANKTRDDFRYASPSMAVTNVRAGQNECSVG
jgi:hypothetical protein